MEYRDAERQVFLLPRGAVVTAPNGKFIITDGPDGKVSLSELIVPYDGALLSDGYLLKLYRNRREGTEKE